STIFITSPSRLHFSPRFFFLLLRPPPTSTLFPYTTLFRSLTTTITHDSVGQVTSTATGSVFEQRFVHDPDGRIIEIDETVGGKRSEEHTSELQSQSNLVCRLLLEKKKKKKQKTEK